MSPCIPSQGKRISIPRPAGKEIRLLSGRFLSSCAVDQSDTALYGTLQHDDCNHAKNNNSGCSFLDPNPRSYGAEFAKAGGGIWVTMFLETEMS